MVGMYIEPAHQFYLTQFWKGIDHLRLMQNNCQGWHTDQGLLFMCGEEGNTARGPDIQTVAILDSGTVLTRNAAKLNMLGFRA